MGEAFRGEGEASGSRCAELGDSRDAVFRRGQRSGSPADQWSAASRSSPYSESKKATHCVRILQSEPHQSI
jgi:hypothetical protein